MAEFPNGGSGEGTEGPPGPTGATGPQGVKGDTGATGPKGEAGSGAALTWHALPLASGIEAFGSPYQAPEYAWDNDHIYFRGLPKAPGVHAGQVLANLAAESIPSHKRAAAAGGANGQAERYLLVIETDGTFKIAEVSALAEVGLPLLDDLTVAK